MSGRDALLAEWEAWREDELTPALFLRDDDAVDDTPALRRLLDQCAGAPLLLAIIPEPSTEALAALVAQHPAVTPAVHGWRHANHAPAGEKASETHASRPPSAILAELQAGRGRLEELFEDRVSALYVPPWNRLGAGAAPLLREAGFAGVSAHTSGPTPQGVAVRVDVDVDIVHWSGGRRGRDADWCSAALAAAFAQARRDRRPAVGLLTHHLAHDETAWASVAAVLDTARGAGVALVAADALRPQA